MPQVRRQAAEGFIDRMHEAADADEVHASIWQTDGDSEPIFSSESESETGSE